jgi:hypothetical protein
MDVQREAEVSRLPDSEQSLFRLVIPLLLPLFAAPSPCRFPTPPRSPVQPDSIQKLTDIGRQGNEGF